VLLREVPAVANATIVRPTSAGSPASYTSVAAQDRDVVAEHGRDLVRVARAPDVAQQVSQYVGRASAVSAPNSRHIASRADTTAAAIRAAVRTRCPAQRERHHEFAETERRTSNGESSRCGDEGRRYTLACRRQEREEGQVKPPFHRTFHP
jgi:hypothetical protein